MELSKQWVSIELAKRLKELGVKQESLFYWVLKGDGTYIWQFKNPWDSEYLHFERDISAFTVAELGDIIKTHEWDGELQGMPITTVAGKWRVDLEDEGMLCSEDNEADARAKMLIYLLEHKLIEL